MSSRLRFAVRSHVGLIREGNEDSAYAGPRVLAVADGMGGHAAGEVASAVAVSALADLDDGEPGDELLDELRERATTANDHLRDMVAADAALEGMGTTLTAVLFAGTRIGLLHIGDSRAYLLRDGQLAQITTDHTLVQQLVDSGRISAEEAGSHPQRSLITQALDGRDSIEPDLSVREVRPGDRYLLCSDGLTGPVGSLDTLQEALELDDPQQACDRLVQLALRGGGPDNITVIVADVVDDDTDDGPAAAVAGAAAEHPQDAPAGLEGGAAARARAAERRDAPPAAGPAATSGTSAPAEPGSRRKRRTGVVLAVLVALLAVSGGAAYAYVRSQYYVGVDGERVAVFRGVSGDLAGIAMSSLEERTDLDVARLDTLALGRLEQGIVAEDRADARQIVTRLEQRFPECVEDPAPAATPAPSATAPPAGPAAVPTCPDAP